MDEVATFTLRIYFPVYGGFDGTPINLELGIAEPPRPTEFKYLWRWWYRVMLKDSANNEVNYDYLEKRVEGILGSQEKASKYIVRVEDFESPKDIDSLNQEINEIVNSLIECFSKSHEEQKNTRFTCNQDDVPVTINLVSFFNGDYKTSLLSQDIVTHIDKLKEKVNTNEKVKEFAHKIQLAANTRLRLILFRRKDERDDIIKIDKYCKLYFPLINEKNKEPFRKYVARIVSQLFYINEDNERNNIRIKLRVYTRKDCDERDLIPLIVGMIFDGIGAGSSRGLGSIVIEDIESNCISKELINIVKSIFTAPSKECLEGKIRDLISYISKKYSQYFAIPDTQDIKPTNVPSFQSFSYEAILCRGNGIECLRKIWKAVLKSEWKNYVTYKDTQVVNTECFGGNLHTEVLGLPRSQRNRSRKNSGYLSDYSRRSYIGFKLIGNIILIHRFYSLDFPFELRWKGKHYSNLAINLKIAEPHEELPCKGVVLTKEACVEMEGRKCRRGLDDEDDYIRRRDYIVKSVDSAVKFIREILQR